MQFRLRSLLILTALVAVLTMPAYRFSLELYERWSAEAPVPAKPVTTVVSVPDGGTIIMGGGIKLRATKLFPITTQVD